MQTVDRPIHWKLLGAIENFWFKETDSRAYEVVRIGYGITALVNWYRLWGIRDSLFSTDSLIDKALVDPSSLRWSLFLWFDASWFVTLTFLVALVAIWGVIRGSHYRLAIIVCWIWHVSTGNVLGPMAFGTNTLLRVVGFILMISPGATRWSDDSRRLGNEQMVAPVYGLRIIQIQLCIMYLLCVWLKYPDPYWRSGDLISYFFLSIYSNFPHPVFASLRELSVILSYATLFIETYVPLLLWFPSTRLFAFVLGFGLHGAIAVGSNVPCLSLATLTMYCAFLTAADFDKLSFAISWLRKGLRRS